MMRKIIAVAMCVLLALMAVSGQDRNITILGITNATGDETGSTLTKTTRDIIETGIKYIGTFKLLPTPSFKIGTDKQSLKEYADLTGSEYILFGILFRAKNGSNTLINNLYCHADDSVFEAREPIENALDIFSASDSMSLKILSELYKTKIAYGTLTLKPAAGTGPGEKKYDVYVNDILAGSNCASIANIPDGDKAVKVISRAGRDDGKVIFSDHVLIKANASTPITVNFQDLGARVAATSDKGLLTITSDPEGLMIVVDDGEPATTPLSLEVTPGTHKFEPKTSIANGRFYEGQPIQWVTVPAGQEAVIPLKPKPMHGTLDYGFIPEDCTIFLDGVEVSRDDSKRFDCLAGVYNIEVKRGETTLVYQWASIESDTMHQVPWGQVRETAFRVEAREISFRAKSTSWDDVKAAYETTSRNWFAGSDKYSMMSIKFARDKKFFYWHVEFAETNPIESVPSGTGGRTVMQLDIQRVKGSANLNINLLSDMTSGGGLWDNPKQNWQDLSLALNRVSTKNSLTGRISLSSLRDHVGASEFEVYMRTAPSDWKFSTERRIGWIDFSFLKK